MGTVRNLIEKVMQPTQHATWIERLLPLKEVKSSMEDLEKFVFSYDTVKNQPNFLAKFARKINQMKEYIP